MCFFAHSVSELRDDAAERYGMPNMSSQLAPTGSSPAISMSGTVIIESAW